MKIYEIIWHIVNTYFEITWKHDSMLQYVAMAVEVTTRGMVYRGSECRPSHSSEDGTYPTWLPGRFGSVSTRATPESPCFKHLQTRVSIKVETIRNLLRNCCKKTATYRNTEETKHADLARCYNTWSYGSVGSYGSYPGHLGGPKSLGPCLRHRRLPCHAAMNQKKFAFIKNNSYNMLQFKSIQHIQQFPLHLRKQSGMSTMKHPRNRLES